MSYEYFPVFHGESILSAGQIRFKDENVRKYLEKISKGLEDPPEAQIKKTEQIIRKDIANHFNTEMSPSGRWAKLSEEYSKRRIQGKRILEQSGKLRKSIRVYHTRVKKGSLDISVKVTGEAKKYGYVLNYGSLGVSIQSKKNLATYESRFAQKTGGKVPKGNGSMPARRLAWISPIARQEINESWSEFVRNAESSG